MTAARGPLSTSTCVPHIAKWVTACMSDKITSRSDQVMIAMRSDWIRGSSVAKKTVKPTRLPTRKPGIERYNRIIEAAEALILEAGSLQGIPLDAVAKRADVPRVSLYYFFDSIESLMDAL